jgi:HEAT repeat protein
MRQALKFFLVLSVVVCAGAWAAAQTPADTRALLSQLEIEHDRNGHFAALFRTGDERIEDLLRALDDPDAEVSGNAQLVIRYLGNREGMAGLIRHYAKSDALRIVGPVPVPLTEWDYDFITKTYLGKPDNFGVLSAQYLYALALDGSPRARELLARMLETARAVGTDATTLNAVSSGRLRSVINSDPKDLAAEVLKAAEFLSPADKKHASAKLLAFNKAQDKALLEVYVNHGVLAEETYHVVLSKRGPGWAFFSVTLVSNS